MFRMYRRLYFIIVLRFGAFHPSCLCVSVTDRSGGSFRYDTRFPFSRIADYIILQHLLAYRLVSHASQFSYLTKQRLRVFVSEAYTFSYQTFIRSDSSRFHFSVAPDAIALSRSGAYSSSLVTLFSFF